jgi:RNA polymerase sigma-70 factor (ECF subfamily)
MTQQELYSKLKKGDELAYKKVFDDFYPVLVAFANKYLRDVEWAKEISQNAFVKLYEKRHTIEITTSLKSYLFKMIYHDCLNSLKIRNRIKEHYVDFSENNETQIEYNDYTEESEDEYRIHNAIENLPPKCQYIIKQSRFEGRKNKDIADELNISVRTVETHISHALKLIRSGLNIFF